MAIREYIGARYVPRFTGLYNPTTIYEALDVVDNGSGTSYISRRTVPAGTPLTDVSYWAVYGASSGAILDLQNRMTAAENSINTLNTDIKEAYSLFKNKRVVVYGDSTAALPNSYINVLAASGICTSLTNRAVSGTLMNSGSNSGVQLINGASDLYNYDLIVLCYGTNEWQASRIEFNLREDIKALFNSIANKNALMDILFITPPYSFRDFGNDTPNLNNAGMYLSDVNNVLIEMCNEFKVSNIDLYPISGCNEFNYTAMLDPSLSDPSIYVHPNTAFANEIFKIITKGATNNQADYFETPLIKSYDFYKQQKAVSMTDVPTYYRTDIILKLTGGETAYSTKKTVRNIYEYRVKGHCTEDVVLTFGGFSKTIESGYFDFKFVMNPTNITPIALLCASDCIVSNFQIYACSTLRTIDAQNTTDAHGRAIAITLASNVSPGGIRPQYVYADNRIDLPFGTLRATTNIAANTVIGTFDNRFPTDLAAYPIKATSTNGQIYPLAIENGALKTMAALEENRVLYICDSVPVPFNAQLFF